MLWGGFLWAKKTIDEEFELITTFILKAFL